ncbi:unnamed protein product [Microthlaspi erraticum]|uniref:Reverse transcriptase Ty1/copia-type domain-containing protein n=1 Tax=Microthlaspi erraticum TaxID=1685480 RepID=A0A6D2J381_9BRAS|nr:unnamed protein product [Microthlaspi erraticum]
MTKEFKMSMVGELKYFLGLQVNQTEKGIFVGCIGKGILKILGDIELIAVDNRRASIVVRNDPELIDILAMNGVDGPQTSALGVSAPLPPLKPTSCASQSTTTKVVVVSHGVGGGRESLFDH